MKVDGKDTRTIWLEPDGWSVGIIDQTALPHRFVKLRLATLEHAAYAIKSMQDASKQRGTDGGSDEMPIKLLYAGVAGGAAADHHSGWHALCRPTRPR